MEQKNHVLEWLKTSASFTLFKSLVGRLIPDHKRTFPVPTNYQMMGVNAVNLSDSLVHAYLTNYTIVEALAHMYGFKYFFFWQPVVGISNKSLTQEEQVFKSDLGPSRVDLFDAVYQKIELAATKYKNLYYIARVFDQLDSQIYFDSHHVTPEGNQLVATKMLDVIRNRLAGE